MLGRGYDEKSRGSSSRNGRQTNNHLHGHDRRGNDRPNVRSNPFRMSGATTGQNQSNDNINRNKSSKNNKIEALKQTKNNRIEALKKQTELYSELSEKLEEKLAKREAEVQALRSANQVLHKECNRHTTRIANLETQCVARSAKVAQLSDMIATKRSDKVQERLMEKSLEVADLIEETERLKIQNKQMQREKTKNGRLMLEMSDIIRQLNKIEVKYDKAEGDKKYFEMNRVRYYDDSLTPFAGSPQDAPLENVRRKIATIERVLREGESLRREHGFQKGRIESLRRDNENLNVEIASLQVKLRDQADQHRQKMELQMLKQRANEEQTVHETVHQTVSSGSGSEYTFCTTSGEEEDHGQLSKEVSYEEFVVENERSQSEDGSEDSGMDDSYRSHPQFSRVNKPLSPVVEANSSVEKGLCSSSSSSDESNSDTSSCDSSLSTLDSPPSFVEENSPKETSSPSHTNSIDHEEHEKLKQNFDKALDVIERLKSDLKERKTRNVEMLINSTRSYASNDDRVERELERTKAQYKVLQDEFKTLHDRHQTVLANSRTNHTDYEASYNEMVSMKENSDRALKEVSDMNHLLRQQYDDLENEYTLKIESLEQKLKEFRNQRKHGTDLQNKNYEELLKKAREEITTMQSIHQDRIEELAKDHVKALEEVQKTHEDLKYEYDTFLEIHLKLEEDALQAKMHYKESLVKIRAMESESRDNREATEKMKLEHRETVEKANEIHEEELKKMEEVVEEWKRKFHKIEEEYALAIKTEEEAKDKFALDLETLKKDHHLALAKQEELRKSDAAAYQKLRQEFNAALIEHGKKEQSTIHSYEQVKRDYESKMRGYQHKIDEFEKLLAMAKDGNEQEVKRLVGEIQLESREKTEQLQAKLKETARLVELEADAKQKIMEEQAESKEKLSRLEASNDELREQIEASKNELNKRATTHDLELEKSENEFRVKLEETIGRLNAETELNQSLQQKQAITGEKLNRLVESNKELRDRAERQECELKESRDNQNQVRNTYHELTSSYQASLLKIESLLQQRENVNTPKVLQISTKKDGEESRTEKGGTVFERIQKFEKKAEPIAAKTKLSRKALSDSNIDSMFQRDFDMILNKIGFDSCIETNSEESVTSSSVDSAADRKTLFEAIVNRVDEHAEKMEDIQKLKRTFEEDAVAIDQIFDVLYHFVQLRKVNNIVLRLPQFGNNEITNELQNDDNKSNRIISDLLIHKKRFKGVQSCLLRRTMVTHLDEMYPSRLGDVYSSTCSHSRFSITPSELGYSVPCTKSPNQVHKNPVSDDKDFGIGTNKSNIAMHRARLEAARLQDENFANQVNISTEEIKTKAREKEVRLLDLKYKTLKEEFRELTANEVQKPPSNIAVPNIDDNGDSESYQPSLAMSSVTQPTMLGISRVDSLHKQVLAAELKVECSRRELKGQKSWVNEARREQQKISKNLKSVVSHLHDLEILEETDYNESMAEDDSFLSSHLGENLSEDREAIWDMISKSVQNRVSPASSDENTEDTSLNPASTISSERRDDKNMYRSSPTKIEGADQTHCPQIDHELDTNSKKIHGIQVELRKAKEAAEAARRKQLEREEALRDVIFQYRELEKEHKAVTGKRQQEGLGQQSMTNTDCEDPTAMAAIVSELKQAQENVNIMKGELEKASERHCEEKDGLRHIMGQYKALQDDFVKILSEKQELEKFVYQRPGMSSVGNNGFVENSSSLIEAPIGVSSPSGPMNEQQIRRDPRSIFVPNNDSVVTSNEKNSEVIGLKQLRFVGASSASPKRVGPPINSNHQQQHQRKSTNTIVELNDSDRVPLVRLNRSRGSEIRSSDKTPNANANVLQGSIATTSSETINQRPSSKKMGTPLKSSLKRQSTVSGISIEKDSESSLQKRHNFPQQSKQTQMQKRKLSQPQRQKEQLPQFSPTMPTSKKKLGIFRGFGFHGGKKQPREKAAS